MNLTRSKRLTPTMRRQLAEMATIATEGKTGAAHWRPFGSEWATAEALERRGFLKQDFSNYGRGNVYTLTPEGLAAVTSTGKQEPSWRESIEGLGPRELAPVLMDNEADALLSMLEQANNAGIVPGIGLRVEDAQSAGFKIVAERFRDTDPYCRGARTIAVRLRSPNPDDTTSREDRP